MWGGGGGGVVVGGGGGGGGGGGRIAGVRGSCAVRFKQFQLHAVVRYYYWLRRTYSLFKPLIFENSTTLKNFQVSFYDCSTFSFSL